MRYTIECEMEDDGRWLAEVRELAGVQAYAATAEAATSKVEILALRVLADRLEHGEVKPLDINISIPAVA